MDSESVQPKIEAGVPIFSDLDTKLRDDVTGEFLAQCLEMLHVVRSELAGPVRTDAPYKYESNLMDGALRAADQVLRSMWAGFHPRSVSYGHVTSL
jgi:hypothetical protein